MATRRNLLLTRASTSARVHNFPRCWWYIFRSLACNASVLRGAEREAYEEFKRRGGTLHLYNKAAR